MKSIISLLFKDFTQVSEAFTLNIHSCLWE